MALSRTTLLFAYATTLALVVSANAKLTTMSMSIFRCPEAPRCGFLAVSMHKVSPNDTTACQETCVILPMLKANLKCGACPKSVASALPPARLSSATVHLAPAVAHTRGATTGSPSVHRTPRTAPVAAPHNTPPTRRPVSSPATPPTKPASTVAAPNSVLKKWIRTPTVAPVSSRQPGGYNIQLQLVGIPTVDQAYFSQAKSRWESVITGDLMDTTNLGLIDMGGGCAYPSKIDDLYICASYTAIDGDKNIVGLAGPHYNRASDLTPFVGKMEFDLADIQFLTDKGSFVDTVLHEMGHVLGVGTNWDDTGVTGAKTAACPYRGVNANLEYQAISGCSTTIPTEQDAAKGACKHWDEECLVDELMTGVLAAGSKALLSRITIGSLADLGYEVDYSKADLYTKANLGHGCTCGRRIERSLSEMNHGDTLQLGLQSRRDVQPRRLSEKLRQSAMEYGQAVLASRALDHANRKLINIDDAVYVGDQIISVLVREGDDVHGVIVKRIV
jgi:Leishmanolysin